MVCACDYVGIVSAYKKKTKVVKVKLFPALPYALEFLVISYDDENECLKGRIANVFVDERIIGKNGNVDSFLFHPIIFDGMNHQNIGLCQGGGKAFSIGKTLMEP